MYSGSRDRILNIFLSFLVDEGVIWKMLCMLEHIILDDVSRILLRSSDKNINASEAFFGQEFS